MGYLNKTCGMCSEIKDEGMFYKRTRGDRQAACKKCQHELQRLSRRRQKENLVEEFGGKCSSCGYSKCLDALEFHHIDPSTKNFGLSAIWRIGLVRAREEAKKCILLCANCHREVEEL